MAYRASNSFSDKPQDNYMKTLILILLLTMPFTAYAVDSESIVTALQTVSTVDTIGDMNITKGINKVLEEDPLAQKRKMKPMDIVRLTFALERASIATGVDWELLLAVSYVESNLCQDEWIIGDRKKRATAYELQDHWSVGCMQVHLYFWGDAVAGAGLTQSDLLKYEEGLIVGGLILKQKIDRYGKKKGIQRYNGSTTESEEYRDKVLKVYNLLI